SSSSRSFQGRDLRFKFLDGSAKGWTDDLAFRIAGDSCTRAGSGDDTVHQRTRLNSTGGGRLYGLTLENQCRGSTTPTSRAPLPRSCSEKRTAQWVRSSVVSMMAKLKRTYQSHFSIRSASPSAPARGNATSVGGLPPPGPIHRALGRHLAPFRKIFR